MKKNVLFLLLLLFLSCFLFASEEKPMKIRTRIPEDYSVSFPSDTMMLDHIAFELKLEAGSESLIRNNGIYSLSYLESGMNSLELSLLYYGNQSEEYSALIRVDANEGWVGQNKASSIPMSIELNKSEYVEEGLDVIEVGEGLIELKVEPMGPRNGTEFAKLYFIWDVAQNAMAGEYEANINISLEAK